MEFSKEEIEILQFPCTMCEEKFLTREDRNMHIENHFKQFECSTCGEIFIGDRRYAYHQEAKRCRKSTDVPKIDSPDIPKSGLECPTCGMSNFQSNRSLKIHIGKFHTEKKSPETIIKYECGTCGKHFANQHILKNHIHEIHTNAQQNECKDCGRLFNRLANLRHHELIHKNELPCKCTICGKAFRTSSGVRLHLRTHTGDKPYKCDMCNDKAYAYNTDLVRHKRSAHGIFSKTFTCELCQNTYYERKHLRNHMKRAHDLEDGVELIAADYEA